MRHINIPIFIPHLGCPNDCVFCNQRAISGKRSFDEGDVKAEIETALSTVKSDDETEIAFFGGSFTGIDRGLMTRLLALADSYIKAGRVKSIRLSTRPDYIDAEILDILSRYGVRDVELGIQSMNDSVLQLCRRGHTASQTEKACSMIKAAGFRLVGQMMTGLPGATSADEVFTARRICEMGADGARIYPTIVFGSTELENMTAQKKYIPPTLEESVQRTADALEVFIGRKVPVIRIGLCSAENLYAENGIAAGAYHPALGELIEGEVYYRRLCAALDKYPIEQLDGATAACYVAPNCISKAVGQNRCNRERILKKYPLKKLVFHRRDMDEYRAEIEIFPSHKQRL